MLCKVCGSTMVPLKEACGWHVCTNCYHLENFNKLPTINIIDENNKADKVYILACSKKAHNTDEQRTYLIDEDKKIKLEFYSDGYEGITAEHLKGILNFLGIKYFECVYLKLPEKYHYEYKSYNWRGLFNENI